MKKWLISIMVLLVLTIVACFFMWLGAKVEFNSGWAVSLTSLGALICLIIGFFGRKKEDESSSEEGNEP